MGKRLKLKRTYDGADRSASRYRVTLFLPDGMYPRGTFCTPDSLFHADEQIVFAVSHGVPWHAVSEKLPYSEVDWLLPDVVRLLGALIFVEPIDGIRNIFYPLPYSAFVVNEVQLDLTRPDTAYDLKAALMNTVNNRLWTHQRRTWEACHKSEFDLFDPHELSIDHYQRCWAAISTDNHILMRGIQALVKADMLARHHEFREEAIIATFIALDASFEMVLRKLRSLGKMNPTAHDAGDWLYETFEQPLGVEAAEGLKYFEEFYSQRVQTLHPGSRWGDLPFAPVMADDYIFLRGVLPGVFSHLCLGEHLPSFHVAVEESRHYDETAAGTAGG